MARRDIIDDPVVADVRKIRAKLVRRAGGTIRGLIELVQRESEAAAKPKRKRAKRAAKSSRRRAG